MRTLKTVLVTTAVLLLGAALTVAGFVIWSQQQMLDELSVRVYLLDKQMSDVQNRTTENDNRLTRTIRTANKNFSGVRNREDGLEAAVKLILKAIIAAEPDPTRFSPNTNGL